MTNFDLIQQKLQHFIKKYYTNEIIKGSILFISFGLLYMIVVLLIEYFLWLKPFARTILFWVFILVELILLTKFILFPVFKLIGLKKGISPTKASKIIGRHFTDVDDKLLNILQLKNSFDKQESELLLAGIEQKSLNIKPIKFRNAILFSTNKKYLKYLILPAIILLFSIFTGTYNWFTSSFDRVVHHKIAYTPPAPFQYIINNKSLQTVQGKKFVLNISTSGNVQPEVMKIFLNNEGHYLNKDKNNNFSYVFEMPNKDIPFYLEANGIASNDFLVKVIKAPRITDFLMRLNYPSYTKKKGEVVKNTGNAVIPEGTKITWEIKTRNSDIVRFNSGLNNKTIDSFNKSSIDLFKYTKRITKNTFYKISTSNKLIRNFENLEYKLIVEKDQYPDINVKSDIDSVKRSPVQFVGKLSDDYGLLKLLVVAKNLDNNDLIKYDIKIGKSDFEEFFYVFPEGLELKEKGKYEIYFEIFDNDKVNGSKKSTSKSFYFQNKANTELQEEILEEQKQNILELEKKNKESDDFRKALKEFSNDLKTKKDLSWKDEKQVKDFIKRQKQYREMMQDKLDNIVKNLDELEENEEMKESKNDLEKLLKENKELNEKEKLLKELQELTEKLKKEKLIEKLEKLNAQTKQEKKSLERILELTKKFYLERKANQITRKLDDLAKEQFKLSKDSLNNSSKQKDLNNKFDSIKKEFKELNKMNKKLKQPTALPETKTDEDLIKMDMEKAEDDLKKSEKDKNSSSEQSKNNAKKKQKSASKKMNELSQKLKSEMAQMQAEGIEENIKDLKQILENLLIFSFEQEELMISFNQISSKNADYPEKLRKQVQLKEHFEHIDDSLYTLSLRLVKLSTKIQKDLADAHYNLDQSLANISENRIVKGISNQQYTMTAANNLADLLSDILQSLQNPKSGKGKGKGKKGEEISLPDIIKKQKDLIKQMKQGIKPSPSGKEKSKEQLTGEQYQIYKEQSKLKEMLQQILQDNPNGKKLITQMDKLEKELLRKGLNKESLEQMQKLEHELLKLDNASFDKNKDKKRKSNRATNSLERKKIPDIISNPIKFNEDEILIRKNLQFSPIYKNKTKQYFKNIN